MNIQALATLWNCTQRHHGTSGARVSAGVLLGLYNGDRFPFDLVGLRSLDSTYLKAAIEVILSDASRCEREVHEWLNQITGRRDFGSRFEILAYEHRFKGRCKREYLDSVSPANLIIGTSDEATAMRRELGQTASIEISADINERAAASKPAP